MTEIFMPNFNNTILASSKFDIIRRQLLLSFPYLLQLSLYVRCSVNNYPVVNIINFLAILLYADSNVCREASFGNSVIVVIYSQCFTYDMK